MVQILVLTCILYQNTQIVGHQVAQSSFVGRAKPMWEHNRSIDDGAVHELQLTHRCLERNAQHAERNHQNKIHV